LVYTAWNGQARVSPGSVALVDGMLGRLPPVNGLLLGPPAGYRFPREVIAVAVRWYLRYGLSDRDVEELLAERGITSIT
jgi:hypothetical protein